MINNMKVFELKEYIRKNGLFPGQWQEQKNNRITNYTVTNGDMTYILYALHTTKDNRKKGSRIMGDKVTRKCYLTLDIFDANNHKETLDLKAFSATNDRNKTEKHISDIKQYANQKFGIENIKFVYSR